MRTRGYPPATPCLTELSGVDTDVVVPFYTGLFGWDAADDATGVRFTIRDLRVASARPDGADRPTWLTHISTDDLSASVTAATGAGGRILSRSDEAAVVADPAGAVFGLRAGGHGGAQLHEEPGAVCWSDLRTADTTAAETFYAAVFDWKARPGEAAPGMTYLEWWSRGRAVCGMSELPAEAAVTAHWSTTFEVADCEAAADTCVRLGGTVHQPPWDVGIGTYAGLSDPAGAAFGVISLIPELRL
ncbi:hypothetical protein LX16_4655 [Stackebrandtia albiflava]|uniref:VOC domain-containing protein n=1 Tax=Stackebrandtia albiflava TaxID=406432 RepID=A0A562UQK5_9ACTN|nr:VOC family protein [Stackebrandtia albiflava]TWJ07874.1 hypothetical protein LX16_4655 [Stackebrandtia albiflava]